MIYYDTKYMFILVGARQHDAQRLELREWRRAVLAPRASGREA